MIEIYKYTRYGLRIIINHVKNQNTTLIQIIIIFNITIMHLKIHILQHYTIVITISLNCNITKL